MFRTIGYQQPIKVQVKTINWDVWNTWNVTVDVCLSLPCDFFMSFEAKARFPCWKWVKSVVKSFGLNSCPTDFQPNALSQTPWPASYPPVKHTKIKVVPLLWNQNVRCPIHPVRYKLAHFQPSFFTLIVNPEKLFSFISKVVFSYFPPFNTKHTESTKASVYTASVSAHQTICHEVFNFKNVHHNMTTGVTQAVLKHLGLMSL